MSFTSDKQRKAFYAARMLKARKAWMTIDEGSFRTVYDVPVVRGSKGLLVKARSANAPSSHRGTGDTKRAHLREYDLFEKYGGKPAVDMRRKGLPRIKVRFPRVYGLDTSAEGTPFVVQRATGKAITRAKENWSREKRKAVHAALNILATKHRLGDLHGWNVYARDKKSNTLWVIDAGHTFSHDKTFVPRNAMSPLSSKFTSASKNSGQFWTPKHKYQKQGGKWVKQSTRRRSNWVAQSGSWKRESSVGTGSPRSVRRSSARDAWSWRRVPPPSSVPGGRKRKKRSSS